VFARHRAECGQNIVCHACGAKFLSKNALHKHVRRKNHQETASSSSPSQKATKEPSIALLPDCPSSSSPTTGLSSSSLPCVQIVVKQVVKLSKSVSVAVQTEGPVDGDVGLAGPSASPADKASSYGECPPTFHQSSSSCLDFSTQTEDGFHGSLHSSFDFSDLATQTDLSELLNFSTRSTSSQTCLLTSGEDLSRYLQTSSDQSSDDSILRGTVDSAIRSSSPFRRQPPELPLALECVGTQTSLAGTGPSERLVMGTQTTLSGTDPPEMLVMGTQTIPVGTCLSEGLGTATQTSPEDWFCPLGEDSRTDFGTQTVDWLTDMADLLPPSSFTSPPVSYESTPRTQHH